MAEYSITKGNILRVRQYEYPTSQSAWEDINEMFINADESMFGDNKGGVLQGGVAFAYNIVINIKKAWMEPAFDFGKMFGYREQKWTLLLNNYVNLNTLDLLRSQIRVIEGKKSKDYNVTFSFDNTHTNGKGCLIAAAFCRRHDLDIPIIIANLRSSEITKRLAFDLLLLQRLGEYVYGEDVTFMLQLNCNKMYCNEETVIMYDNWYHIKKVIKKFDRYNERAYLWNKSVIRCLNKFRTCKKEEIKYKVFVRTLRQLQPDLFPGNYKPLYARDLLLQYDSIEYPDECITYTQRQKYKAKYIKSLKNKNNG